MTGNRNRSAWIWVAIAAISFASVSRAEAGLQNAKSYAHPVLAFLAKSQGQFPVTQPGAARFVQRGTGLQSHSMYRDAGTGTWTAILPVWFIGLVAPLSLLSAASIPSLGRTPASPLLPFSFQRPPPILL
jgi:hypothetical protein